MVVRCTEELPAAIIGIFRRRSDREQNRVLTRSYMVANDCRKRAVPVTHSTHAVYLHRAFWHSRRTCTRIAALVQFTPVRWLGAVAGWEARRYVGGCWSCGNWRSPGA